MVFGGKSGRSASQIYYCVSNFSRATYLRARVVKRKERRGKKRVKKEGRGLEVAKSVRTQRGRRLRGIDPQIDLHKLRAHIDQIGERPGEAGSTLRPTTPRDTEREKH